MYQIYAFPSINPSEVDDTLILLAKSLQKVNIEFVVNNYEKRMTYFSNSKNMSGISMRITLTDSRDALELKKIIQHVAYNPGAVIFSGYRTKDYKMYFSQSPYIFLEAANKKSAFFENSIVSYEQLFKTCTIKTVERNDTQKWCEKNKVSNLKKVHQSAKSEIFKANFQGKSVFIKQSIFRSGMDIFGRDGNVRLVNEYKKLMSLSTSNAFPNVYFMERYKDGFILCLQRMKGENLQKFLNNMHLRSDFNSDIISSIATCLINAVNKMHNNYIVHRDLKPENIIVNMVNNDIQVSIIDLEISCLENDESPLWGGTKGYVPPKIPITFPRNHFCFDNFALGIIIMMLCTKVNYPDLALFEKIFKNKTAYRILDKKLVHLFFYGYRLSQEYLNHK